MSFFIRGICQSDVGYLNIIYIVHIHLCCKKMFRFENDQFQYSEIGFHGDTFVARQHNTYCIFHFH